MKKRLLFLLIALPAAVHSQETDSIKGTFILASIGFEMGPMMDRYSSIDLDMMYDLTQNPLELDRNLVDHSTTYDNIAEGSRLGVSLSFIPLKKKISDYSKTSELRLGLFYSVRGTNLSYDFQDTSGARQSVNYSTRFKELSVNGAYVWKYNPTFAQRFTLTGGLGIGIGSTLYDKTSVAEHFTQGEVNEIPFSKFNAYKGKTSLFLRTYVPIGIDFALAERFDVGLAGTVGIGLQKVMKGDAYFIPFSGSVGVKVSYYF